MASKLEPTNTPGIFRRHVKGCPRGRCKCSYVVVWRHRGKQHKQTFRTLAEAREAKGNRDAGDRRPIARVRVRGLLRRLDRVLRRPHRAGVLGDDPAGVPSPDRASTRSRRWGTWRLAEIEPTDVRELFGELRKRRRRPRRRSRSCGRALSAMFATAVEDGLLRSNPVQRRTHPPAASDEQPEEDDRAKALTRAELALFLAALPSDWRLFFEFLAHTGLRISEAIGLTWAHLDLGERPRVRSASSSTRASVGS